MNKQKGILITFVICLTIFIVAILVPRVAGLSSNFALATTQFLECFLAILAISFFGKNRFAEYGFRKSSHDYYAQNSFFRFFLLGLTAISLGALTSIIMMSSGASGNPLIKELSFPRIILHVWIISSIVEEIFTRGFLQSHLFFLRESKIKLITIEIDVPTLLSAAFFASMHFVLFLSGADILTIIIIVLFTFSLGLLAGHQRAKSESLLPPIILHFLANFGGFLGSLLYMIGSLIITGSLPQVQ